MCHADSSEGFNDLCVLTVVESPACDAALMRKQGDSAVWLLLRSTPGLLGHSGNTGARQAWRGRDVPRLPPQPDCSGYGRPQEGTEELNLDRARRTRLESVEILYVCPQRNDGRGLWTSGQEPQWSTRAAALK